MTWKLRGLDVKCLFCHYGMSPVLMRIAGVSEQSPELETWIIKDQIWMKKLLPKFEKAEKFQI